MDVAIQTLLTIAQQHGNYSLLQEYMEYFEKQRDLAIEAVNYLNDLMTQQQGEV